MDTEKARLKKLKKEELIDIILDQYKTIDREVERGDNLADELREYRMQPQSKYEIQRLDEVGNVLFLEA